LVAPSAAWDLSCRYLEVDDDDGDERDDPVDPGGLCGVALEGMVVALKGWLDSVSSEGGRGSRSEGDNPSKGLPKG